MIAARMRRDGTPDQLILVVEPGNIAKLELGQPIVKRLNEFLPELPGEVNLVLAFSPDVPWVVEQFNSGRTDLGQIVEESLSRKPNYREGEEAEAMVKAK